jgi:hypothetical protein
MGRVSFLEDTFEDTPKGTLDGHLWRTPLEYTLEMVSSGGVLQGRHPPNFIY